MGVPDDLELFAQMCFLRHFEERTDLLYRRGLIHGPVHLGLGHEAVAVNFTMTVDEYRATLDKRAALLAESDRLKSQRQS